jgi:hypothetical protein
MAVKDMNFEEVFWLIGWIEAEGYMSRMKNGRAPCIDGISKDEDTIDRICAMLGCKKYFVKLRNEKWENTFRFRIERLELGTFLFNASSFMSSRRQQQISKSLEKMSDDEIELLNWQKSLKSKYFNFWLAGYLEGEGSFLPGPPSNPNMSRIQFQTTDEDIADEISAYFGVKYHKLTQRGDYKIAFSVTKRGSEAVKIMEKLLPLMSSRRQAQIRKAILSYKITPQRIVNAKFNKSDIEEIKAMRKNKIKVRKIAAHFNVSHSVISRICSGKSYVSENVNRISYSSHCNDHNSNDVE